MNRRSHPIVSALLAASFWLAQGGLAQDNSDSASSAQAIDVAIVGPMVGTSFAVGTQFRTGVHAALQHLTDGTLMGRPLRITEHNDGCDRNIAEKLAIDLIQSPPDVVIGHSCSAATLVTAPIYAQHHVMQISPASTAPDITDMGITTLFRMIGRDDLQGRLVVQRLLTQHAGQKIGILRFATDYSVSLTQSVIDELATHNITPALIVNSTASATSYLDEIIEFMDAGVEVVYMVGGGLDSGVVARQVAQIDAGFTLIASDTLVSNTYTDTAGPAGDNIPFLFPSDAASVYDSAATRDAMTAIRAMGVEPHGYTMLSFAAAEIWIEGVRRAHSTDAHAVADAIRRAPMSTVLGTVSFDQKGDIQTEYPPYSWFVWQEGERVAIE